MSCDLWEVLLVDALDGALPADESAEFEAHPATCRACAELLANSRQGQEWLRFLHHEPAVPPDLVTKILGRTSGTATPLLAGADAAASMPAVAHLSHFQMQRAFRDSRLLMTGAMALFSIALTLNLAGIRLTQLRLSDLRPSSLHSNLRRSFWSTEGQLVHYYDNLRVVYEVEARVREIRRDAQTEQQTAPEKQPAGKEGARRSGQGSARKNGGKLDIPRHSAPRNVVVGPPALASIDPNSNMHVSGCSPLASAAIHHCEMEVVPLVFFTDDQAEGSLA